MTDPAANAEMRRPILVMVVNDSAFFLSHRLPVARAARAAGWDVHLATPEGPHASAIRSEGFEFHSIPLTRSGTRPWLEVHTLFALWALYRRVRPMLVHHVTIKPVLYGGIAARLARVPAAVGAVAGLGYVFSGNDLRRRLLRVVGTALYRLALGHPNGRAVLQNPDDRACLEEIGAVRPARAVIIPGSGVDLGRFAPRAEPTGTPMVVLPCRLLLEKGVREFVEASRILRGRGIQARFVVAGGLDQDNPSGIAESTVRAWCEEGTVEWWGQCSEMPAVFAASNLVVLPSYYGEGVPKALLEACACGRAIVTTDMPGCREVVHEGVNGLLVPPRDARALADAVARLIASPKERGRMGHRGRARAEAEFSVEEVVRRHLALYEELAPAAAPAALASVKAD